MSKVGKKVLEQINEKGWSIPTTSKRSGVPVATIKNIVYGNSLSHKKNTLEKLAEAFDCDIESLQHYAINKTNESLPDYDLKTLDECTLAINSYIKNNNLKYRKKHLTKAIERLSSFINKRRQKHPDYQIQDDIIELILDN